jgi:predicted PurR-regulated permease PerM
MKDDRGLGDIAAIIIVLIVIFGLMFLFYWFGSPGNSNNIKSTNVYMPKDYDNGVYYFDSRGATFANSLSDFIKRENVTILAISGDGNCGYGADCGYFVVVSRV